jgi:hypothetical protein
MSYLLVSNGDQHQLALLNTADLSLATQFDVPGRVAVLGTSGSGRFGFAVHRDDNAVTIIDGHTGQHLDTVEMAGQPTHFHAHADTIVIFNDGSGTVTLFSEERLQAGDTTPQHIAVGDADHGSAVVIDDILLAGFLRKGTVVAYDITNGEQIDQLDCCPVLHGATQLGQTALFGCGNGVLCIQVNGCSLSASKINNPPDSPKKVRVGLFADDPQQEQVLGNWGSGLMVIDPNEMRMQPLKLSDHPLKFAYDATGNCVLILDTAGNLHKADPVAREIMQTVHLFSAVSTPKGPDKVARPSFAHDERFVYAIAPNEKYLAAVAVATLSTMSAVNLNFTPASIVCLCDKI